MSDATTLVLGTRTVVLVILALQGMVVAGLLLTARRNRTANRLLAALLATLALSLGPDIIGFAGFYDRWPWLTFAPFDIGLLPGPLFYLFVRALTHGSAPARWRLHLAAPAFESGYRVVCFLLPFPLKIRWASGGHESYVGPLLAAVGFLSLVAYTLVAGNLHRRYRQWLVNHVSFGDDFRMPWLQFYLATMGLMIVGVVAFTLTSPAASPDRYFHWFWFHLAVAVAGFAMGVAGLRAAEWSYPALTSPVVARDVAEHLSGPATDVKATDERDVIDALALVARDWQSRMQREGWFRDQLLTLPRLAERLEITESQLSRGLNQGLGVNFNEFVNRLRVTHMQAALADPTETRDLLPIAFEAGFSSKASFNRAFKAATGETPTSYRARTRVSTSPND